MLARPSYSTTNVPRQGAGFLTHFPQQHLTPPVVARCREKFQADITSLTRAKEELEIEYSLLIDKLKQATCDKHLLGDEIEGLRARFDEATKDYVSSPTLPVANWRHSRALIYHERG